MLKGLIIGKDDEHTAQIKTELEAQKLHMEYDLMTTADDKFHIIHTAKYNLIIIGGKTFPKEEFKTKLRAMLYLDGIAHEKQITYKEHHKERLINSDLVLGLEVMGREVYAYTIEGKCIKIRDSLIHVLEKMDDPYFIRCHKSYAVNIKHMIEINKLRRSLWEISFFYETDFQCFVGVAYYNDVIEKYEEWMNQIRPAE